MTSLCNDLDRIPGLIDRNCASSWAAFHRCIARIKVSAFDLACRDKGQHLRRLELIRKGLSPSELVSGYRSQLTRLRLAIDFGEVDVSREVGSDQDAAEAWLDIASEWPPRLKVYGIPVGNRLESALIVMAALGYRNGVFFDCQDVVTERIAMFLVGRQTRGLSAIPDRVKTERVIWRALRHSPLNIMLIEESDLTAEIQLYAVRRYGCCINMIPKEQITPEILAAALKNDSRALEVPHFDYLKKKGMLADFPHAKVRYLPIPSTPYSPSNLKINFMDLLKDC